MDATGLKKKAPQDQATDLRQLATHRVEAGGSVAIAMVDMDRTQAASLIMLARLVREKGVAA